MKTFSQVRRGAGGVNWYMSEGRIPGREADPLALQIDSTDRRRVVIMTQPIERFVTKFRVDPETGCHVWTAAISATGYGNFYVGKWGGKKRFKGAHRWWYEQCVGPVAKGLELDHLCRNRACVNPAHLEPVTPSENNRRKPPEMTGLGGLRGQTHCKRGHAFDEENTYIIPKTGRRSCLTCRRAGTARANRRAADARRAKLSIGSAA